MSYEVLIKKGSYYDKEFYNFKAFCTEKVPKEINGEYFFWIIDQDTGKHKRCKVIDYEVIHKDCSSIDSISVTETSTVSNITSKTREELSSEIQDKFEVMEELYTAVFNGAIKSLIISGSAGTGKSSSIEELLDQQAKLNGYTYSTVKGVVTPLYVFEHVRDNAQENHIIIFDDCDQIFYEHSSLNVLKAALDSKQKRIVTWGSTRGSTDDRSFEFKGSIIFLTNIAFNKLTKNEVLKSHLQALASRSHYFDVSLNSNLERFIRIKQVCEKSNILKGRNLTEENCIEIIAFIEENMDRFSELSLRTVSKIADLFLYNPEKWKKLISLTLFR